MATNLSLQSSDPPSDESSHDTRPADATVDIVAHSVMSKFKWGNANDSSNNGQVVYLDIQDYDEPLVLEFHEEIILGRLVAKDDAIPMLDLTPYGGVDKGVSRTHAVIQRMRNSIVIIDLASVNKTFINGQRIAAYQPHILVEGDEIRLGNLIATISYRHHDQAKV